MRRAKREPLGRAGHRQAVKRVEQAAAEAGLVRLLTAIRDDPDAGEWAGWAGRLLTSDQPECYEPQK